MSFSDDHTVDIKVEPSSNQNAEEELDYHESETINLEPTSISSEEFDNVNGSFEHMHEHNNGVTVDSDNICDKDNSSNNPMSGAHADPFLLSTDADFKKMFKVSHSTFENLVEFLSNEQMEPIEDIPLYKKLLIVLWLLGNSGSYSDAAEMFKVTEEAAANCFFDVCATLYNQSDNIITWPDLNECNEIASRIEQNYGFPGVVGVLGCHYFSISIPKEALSRREHFNGKQKTYCIALQVVCDDNLMIRDIFPGLPGGVTEAQVFSRSPIYEQLASKTECQLIEQNKHILARSSYPQLTYVLTPYSEVNGVLGQEELELNELHENVCHLVDQTLGMLQERFATLKILDPEVATMVLVVTSVIHNFCVGNNDLFGIEN